MCVCAKSSLLLLRFIRTGLALDTDETQVHEVPADVDLATPSPRGGKPAEITPSPVSAPAPAKGGFPDITSDDYVTRRDQFGLRRKNHIDEDGEPKKKASPKKKGKGKGKGKKTKKGTSSSSGSKPSPAVPKEPEVVEPSVEREVVEPKAKAKCAPKSKAIVEEPSVEPEVVQPKAKAKRVPKRKPIVEEPSVEPEVAEPKAKAKCAPKRKPIVEPSVEPEVAVEPKAKAKRAKRKAIVEEPSVEPEVAAEPKAKAKSAKRKAIVEEPSVEPEVAAVPKAKAKSGKRKAIVEPSDEPEEPKAKKARAKNDLIEYSPPLTAKMLKKAILGQFAECRDNACGGPTSIGQFGTESPVRLTPYWTKCQMGVKVYHMQDGTRQLRQPYYLSGASPCWCSLVLCAKQVAARLAWQSRLFEPNFVEPKCPSLFLSRSQLYTPNSESHSHSVYYHQADFACCSILL